MKKIVFMFLLMSAMLALSHVSKAQVSFNHTASNPTGVYANTATDTMSLTLTHGYNKVSIQPVNTRNSGTLGGTIILYRSVNGVDWTNDVGDTLTVTNAAKSPVKIWDKVVPCKYWRIISTGSGTMNATSSAKLQTD